MIVALDGSAFDVGAPQKSGASPKNQRVETKRNSDSPW